LNGGANERTRVLALGHACSSTGYARVLENVLSRLPDRFEPVLFGLNYRGPNVDRPFRVIPNRLMGDPYGRDQLPSLLDELSPDVVLVHHDPAMYSVHRETLVAHRKRHPGTKVAVYCPIEWESISPGLLLTMADADAVVLYNNFGRRVFEQAFATARADAPPTAVIGHGVDETFRRLDGAAARKHARSLIFADRAELADSFIVLNANRNSPRKRIDITLRGFAEFAAEKRDAFLYLHMGMTDLGCDVLALAGELGIRDKLLTSTLAPEHPRVDDDHLNAIYNACDVGLNTSTGEGWGLVAFEHGATGAAQVMPAHPSCAELWADRAILIDTDDDGVVSPSSVARAIEELYVNPDTRAALSVAAHELATASRFSWELVATQWRDLLLGIAEAPDDDLPKGSSIPITSSKADG
jgi:D-inositol-3-phosphate glycosyltransferase